MLECLGVTRRKLCIIIILLSMYNNVLLNSITVTAKSSKKNERKQVNEKFHKLERGYRDCIKRTRDKTRIYSIPHDAPGA